MAYASRNFRTKRQFKDAVASGEFVGVWQPGPFGPNVKDGSVAIEGPHYPEPHKWYATAKVVNGQVVSVK